jgi:hypothetical protein
MGGSGLGQGHARAHGGDDGVFHSLDLLGEVGDLGRAVGRDHDGPVLVGAHQAPGADRHAVDDQRLLHGRHGR